MVKYILYSTGAMMAKQVCLYELVQPDFDFSCELQIGECNL